MNIRKIVRDILKENYPAGAQFDVNAPWNQKEPRYTTSVGADNQELQVIGFYPREIAVLKDAQGNKYVFYIDSVSRKDFAPYAEREIVGAEKGWEEGEVDYEYSDDWDIDEHVVSGYINDNLSSLSTGEGVDGWEDGKDLVKVDEDLKINLLDTYGSNESIKKALEI